MTHCCVNCGFPELSDREKEVYRLFKENPEKLFRIKELFRLLLDEKIDMEYSYLQKCLKGLHSKKLIVKSKWGKQKIFYQLKG